MVTAAELHADALIQQSETPATSQDEEPYVEDQEVYLLADGRTNQNIVDNPTNQRLTMAEIEALKSDVNGSSREIIAKILESHSGIDQKTAFSLAKYTLRKNRKYMKRFCVLPLDVHTLTDWLMNERDFGKAMEIRNETLGLISSWANIHRTEELQLDIQASSRYLMVDDTGGLLVAAVAERMGILGVEEHDSFMAQNESRATEDQQLATADPISKTRQDVSAMSAQSNTITLLHSNSQPNLSLLKYFAFDANSPSAHHPLYTHLKTLSWLQLLSPSSDPVFTEPEIVPPETLANWKSGKRSAYYRKRRRWTRIKSIIDSSRQGDFHGLILATHTSPVSIFQHTIPLLAGAAQVVVYSPHIEVLTELADLYSTARRTAFINTPEELRVVPSEDFPLDPTLLLTPTVQTARLKRWQVLPGRTHPLMMGRGGAEGYVFVATRVLPAKGKVEARGRTGGKRRKVEKPSDTLGVVDAAAVQAQTGE